MAQIKVKERRSAQRCEICHQSDMFDGMTEICLRCRDIASVIKKNRVEFVVVRQPRNEMASWKDLADGLIIVFAISTMLFTALLMDSKTGGAIFVVGMICIIVMLGKRFASNLFE